MVPTTRKRLNEKWVYDPPLILSTFLIGRNAKHAVEGIEKSNMRQEKQNVSPCHHQEPPDCEQHQRHNQTARLFKTPTS